MTRESLAKDMLATMLPMFWSGSTMNGMTDEEGFAFLAGMAVRQADALLEALGTTEPPASWLSKEMQTPAKGFPALREDGRWIPKVGDKVRVKDGLPLPRGLYSGQVGKVASVEDGEVSVAFEVSWLTYMYYDLEPAE